MLYKNILFFFFVLFASGFAQGFDDTADVWDDLHPQTSDDSRVYFSDDSIYIADAETLWVFIPTKFTNGAIYVHGTVTGSNGKAAEAVFEMAPHTGDGTALNAAEPESYQTMATVTAAAGSTSAFNIWPMANSTLKASASNYITLRIRGTTAGNLDGIQITVEYIYQWRERF